jgi:predicted esterase
LITLPGGRQTVEQHLNMWCGGHLPKLNTRAGQGMRNGYVVMAIDWQKPGQNSYQYSALEHGTILKAMRMALRKFAVDTDRVFISGHGIGAEAAYDVGLSHPEHWAGILGTSGKMDKYLDLYEKNKHVALPIYSVAGQNDFETINANKDQWNRWLVSRHFMDCTVVHYLGRGNELLAEEIPEMFKWMAAQRRRNPDKNGFSFEVKAARPWDSYFWFLEFHGVPADMVIWPQQFKPKNVRMAIEGETKAANPNIFRIGPAAGNIDSDATLWLSPEFVNFNEQIQIKGRGKNFKGNANASIKVMLEDVRRRADKKHPYWSRIDCKDLIWQVNN